MVTLLRFQEINCNYASGNQSWLKFGNFIDIRAIDYIFGNLRLLNKSNLSAISGIQFSKVLKNCGNLERTDVEKEIPIESQKGLTFIRTERVNNLLK